MQLTLYPNNELRARITTPPLVKRRDFFVPKKSETPILSIVQNLQACPKDFFRPEKNKPSDRPGYGSPPKLRPFSLYGRRKIVRSGALIGAGENRQKTLFLTGTLPGGTDDALRAISDYSSWIVHILLTRLPELSQVKSADSRVIWVWEWQQRGALHLHAICEFPSRDAAQRVFEGFKGLWIGILESVGARCGIDIAARKDSGTHAGDYASWRTRAEWARKNPSRYLAKYVSKVKKGSLIAQEYPPNRWYGISRCLHAELRSQTLVANTSDATGIPDYHLGGEYDLELIEALFSRSHTTRQFSDKVRTGYTFVFYLNDEDRDFVVDLMKNMRGKQRMKDCNPNKLSSRKKYYYLEIIPRYLRANSVFLASIGEFARDLLEVWYDGEEVPEYELDFLDNFAAECLLNSGCIEQVTSPKRSEAGLTGQCTDRMESAPPPLDNFDQPSLFP
jgi:hypothetical protein